MKKVKFLSLLAAGVFLASCSTGWTEENKETFMKECEGQELIDCDCALEKAMEKYPKIADWNEKGGKDKELATEVAENCSK